ncbi:MAG: 3-deoxy-manno-octulosonate cytidylyltransferase [Thiotrichales bacterium]|nr:3-deoxy-manno-octulosonate cytidylyltransferase [Thiotrichales bacterium]
MNASFVVIIPARHASTRLPGKPLIDICGRSLLEHVYSSACNSAAESVYVATDDERIFQHVESFGGRVLMTSAAHRSGTERLAEAATILELADEQLVVNLQGDEIGMQPAVINQVAQLLKDNPDSHMATVYEAIADLQQVNDPNVVKLVFDQAGRALYFSRSAIPWRKSAGESATDASMDKPYFKHIGLYAYHAGFLQRYARLPVCELEQHESLEQLRALYHGEMIMVAAACAATGIGVDTAEDLEIARKMLAGSY